MVLGNFHRRVNFIQCRLFIRIDDFFWEERKAIETLCGVMKKTGIPYVAAITGDDLVRQGGIDLWKLVVESGGEIAVHGFSHAGKFGPFFSEMLQMRYPEIDSRMQRVTEFLTENDIQSNVFIAPFNAIGREQIGYMGKYFPIVCGGPETVRFTEGFSGPLVMKSGVTYFPSFYPFYGTARAMLDSRIHRVIRKASGYVCLTFHVQAEKEDQFENLQKLLTVLPVKPRSWATLGAREDI
jgi:hypothetical protein